ncbi:MAG: UPF0182 family protein, partial [Gammaproteobacteria bacterium]
MGYLKRTGLILVGVALALVSLYLVLGIAFPRFFVDLWWFDSLGLGSFFWKKLLYRYLVFAVVTLVFFSIFFVNFRIAVRYIDPQARPGSRFRHLRRGSLMVYLPLCLVLAAAIALPLFYRWEGALLYFFAPDSGMRDPVYGNDISYYLFALPIYLLVLSELLVALILVFLGTALLYWSEHRLLAPRGQSIARGARVHLSLLVGLIFFAAMGFFILERHLLLYDDNHMPLFFGPGYVEMHVTLPLIWASIITLMGAGVAVVSRFFTHKGLVPAVLFLGLFGVSLAIRYTGVLPRAIQELVVEPNRIAKETPFIAHNIEATLAAYNLKQVELRAYEVKRPPWDSASPEVRMSLQTVPLWDREVLLPTYTQLQALRPYYEFPAIDVDRYTVNGIYQQVFLSPREINLNKLPEGAMSWVNRWLQYTHGYGAVISQASQLGKQEPTWFMQGLPPHSEPELRLEQPAVYYGLSAYRPAIAPNEAGEVDYPLGTTLLRSDYKGSGGIPISSLFRKLVFALYHGDKNIFFTTLTTGDSRLLLRRNIIERIEKLTPFLRLDGDPYVVVTRERMYWIQDAYTVSRWFPYSTRYQKSVNYIRNAVKIVVDAYNGTVDYYIVDPSDPIITAYSRLYPSLFKRFAEMPGRLKAHVRYPKDLFDMQIHIYAKYHQNPKQLFNHEDQWQIPQLNTAAWGEIEQQIRGSLSRYLTLNLIDRKRFEFVLMAPLTPKGRDNLRAMAVAGCDEENYGRLLVYSFPKGTLVYGPAQINSFIHQNPDIARRFTLWADTSRVIQGQLTLIPVSGVVLYIQPIYLAARTANAIPLLERVIVSSGQTVVME